MTNQEYWQDLYAYHANRLPQHKVLKYKLAGCFAESSARERGTTLVPCNMALGNSPPAQLPENLLVAIGLNTLAINQPIEGGQS